MTELAMLADSSARARLDVLDADFEEAPGAGENETVATRRRLATAGKYLIRRPGLVLSVTVVIVVLVWTFAPGLFASQNPLLGVPSNSLLAPSRAHLFGTDVLGRDEYSRVVYGTNLTLQASLLAVLVGLLVGGGVGLVAGYVGGWIDDAIMRVIDVLLSVPSLIQALAIVTALGFGTLHVAIAVGIASIAGFARVMRAEVLRVSSAAFVEAGRTVGSSGFTILRRHILPNAAGPVLVLAALDFGQAILAVASLSFLGLGAKPPAPVWGGLIADGSDYLATAWWLTVLPGIVVAITVLSTNRIARALEGEGRGRR